MTDSMSNADELAPASDDLAPETATDAASGDDRQREIDDLKDKHLRLAAEYDNFRRRAVKERQEAGWRAQGELVRGLIDALEDLLVEHHGARRRR